MERSLRARAIRLAHERPELRDALLPLLKTAKVKRALPVLPPEVVYGSPMRMFPGQGRKCSNCFMWVNEACLIIDPSKTTVLPGMVCNYHVPGVGAASASKIEYVDAKLAGLTTAPPEGTMCGNCAAYTSENEEEGRCGAVAGKVIGDGPFFEEADVERLGCCSRWNPAT